jgi:prevent-host-death family protein
VCSTRRSGSCGTSKNDPNRGPPLVSAAPHARDPLATLVNLYQFLTGVSPAPGTILAMMAIYAGYHLPIAGGKDVQVNIFEAKNRLSQLIRSVQAGEEVVIANHGEPVARLVPLAKSRLRPQVQAAPEPSFPG